MVRGRQEKIGEIEILEMDELFAFVKKSLNATRAMESLATHIPEYGLLWIATDLKELAM